jgi:CDP-glucose 4,6-dehydratase
MKSADRKPYQNRNVLVTGASGFLGSHLAARLVSQGARVTTLLADWDPASLLVHTGLVNKIRVHVGGVEDFTLVDRVIHSEHIDTVFHLAATATVDMAHGRPLQTFDVNVKGTYNILEACRANSERIARVVVASSDKAYGDAPLPYTENMPMAGQAPYDVSKSCADLIARAYASSYRTPVAVGRFGNIFGPGDLHWSRLIPGTIRRLLLGQRPVVRQPLHGEFRRDFLYVDDAVEAYLAMARGLETGVALGEAFNFAMGSTWTPLEIVRELQQLTGNNAEPELLPQDPGEILHQHVDSSKARGLLGWSPQRTLTEALQETINWYQDHLGLTVPSPRRGRNPIAAVAAAAAASPRRRHYRALSKAEDPIQRVLIGLQPGTYVQPHTHPNVNGRRGDEIFRVLRGSIGLLTFDEAGSIHAVRRLDAGQVAQTPGGVAHTVVCIEPDTVVLEVREGPWRKSEKRCLGGFPSDKALPPDLPVSRWTLLARRSGETPEPEPVDLSGPPPGQHHTAMVLSAADTSAHTLLNSLALSAGNGTTASSEDSSARTSEPVGQPALVSRIAEGGNLSMSATAFGTATGTNSDAQ